MTIKTVKITGKSNGGFRGITMGTETLPTLGQQEAMLNRIDEVYNPIEEFDQRLCLWTSFAFEEGKSNIFEVTCSNYASLNGHLIFENCMRGLDKTLNVKADKIFLSAAKQEEFKARGVKEIRLITFSKGAPVSIAYNDRGDILFGTTIRQNIKNKVELFNLYNYLGGKLTYNMLFTNMYEYADMGNMTMFDYLERSFKEDYDTIFDSSHFAICGQEQDKADLDQTDKVSIEFKLLDANTDGVQILASRSDEQAFEYPFNVEGFKLFDARDKYNNLIEVAIEL